MNNHWLPEDYKEPSISNYMKFQEGDNTFRILTKPILGYEWWEDVKRDDGTKGRKPVRVRTFEDVPADKQDPKLQGAAKYFWAFVVYNQDDARIQILEVTQTSVRKGIKQISEMKQWGSPLEYDITVTREGEGYDTEYSVTPNPKKTLDPEILKRFKAMKIDLEALYDGEDPFADSVPAESQKVPQSVGEISDKNLEEAFKGPVPAGRKSE